MGMPSLYIAAPHIRRERSTGGIMTDVLIGTLPMIGGALWYFGWRAAGLIALCAAVCTACDWLCSALRKHGVVDGSGTVTGVLLALCLPAGVPWWAAALASIFAIAVVKQWCGGIGANIFNPALAGRALLMLAFPRTLMGYARPDALSGATPLSQPDGALLPMLFGAENGSIGETSVILILAGGLYLYFRGVISLRVPVTALWSMGLFLWMWGGSVPFTGNAMAQVLSGGFMLGIFFYATDPVTKPVSPIGEMAFGLGVGIFTAVLRLWGNYPEGICFAVLLMNLAAPLLEYSTRSIVYGKEARI